MVKFTARELGKLEARHRTYKLLYLYFDNLPAHCREAWRQRDDGWTLSELKRCDARVCNHKGGSHGVRYEASARPNH